MTPRVVYLDNNATTRIAPEALAAMLPFLQKHYGNPSSMHAFGGHVARHVQHARDQISSLLGCNSEEIIFTSCGTESDNLGIIGALEALTNERRHLITSMVEHPAVKNTISYLGKKGYRATELPVDRQGMIDLGQLQESISDETALVSIMYANNETGVIFPIEQIGQIVKERGVLLHVDAVQAVGKLPLNMKNSAIDLLSLSGHKIHAPKGVGALYVRKGVRLRPIIIGGHQERGRRGGTEAVPNIIALGKAAELAQQHIAEENNQVKARRDRLERWILENIPATGLNGHPEQRLPNTCNIGFEYVEGEAILLSLSKVGICASSGSACTSGSLEPSHVLRAMGVPFSSIHGSIRLSLSRYTTDEDIDYVIEHLPLIIERLRRISPFKSGSAIPDPQKN